MLLFVMFCRRLGVLAGMLLALPNAAWAQVSTPWSTSTFVDRSEQIARVTVTVRVGPEVRARGVVLANDGRIVTALAPLRGERTVTVSYPNGRTGSATVVATDEPWGLALLQPRTGVWTEGIDLASSARGNTPARWMEGSEPRSRAGLLRRRRTYVGRGSVLLRDAWELDPAPSADAVGSGVANARGELVAVIVPPEPGVQGGALAPFGVPATVVRALVERAGVTARPWLGLVARNLRSDEVTNVPSPGIRVMDVVPQGPAHIAGVRAVPVGDVITGADGRAIRSVEDLAALLESYHPGDTIVLHVVRDGRVMDLPLRLGQHPPIGP